MKANPNRFLWMWLALGVLGYLALPWYAIQDANGLRLVGQVFSQPQAGNGLMQAAVYGKPQPQPGLAIDRRLHQPVAGLRL
ncbi:MAG: hypothetical protein EOO54_03845 [Haliea sp.]|nr:MAG: hypothetical protein EOO54_03845 [Haliea sp.]